MATEKTLILLKPDCVSKGLCGLVLARFEAAGFKIRALKMLRATAALLREHYAHIAERPFFPQVLAFMQQTPIIALILEGEEGISRVRALLGPTDSRQAEKGTIRGDYGVDTMVNVCHASDSPQNAAVEIQRFFQPGEWFDDP